MYPPTPKFHPPKSGGSMGLKNYCSGMYACAPLLQQQQPMLNSARAQLVRGSVHPDLTVSAAQARGYFHLFVSISLHYIIEFYRGLCKNRKDHREKKTKAQ